MPRYRTHARVANENIGRILVVDNDRDVAFVVEAILSIGDITGIEEGACVGRMRGEPGSEFGFCGFPVGLDDGGFSVGNGRRQVLIVLIRVGAETIRAVVKKGRVVDAA